MRYNSRLVGLFREGIVLLFKHVSSSTGGSAFHRTRDLVNRHPIAIALRDIGKLADDVDAWIRQSAVGVSSRGYYDPLRQAIQSVMTTLGEMANPRTVVDLSLFSEKYGKLIQEVNVLVNHPLLPVSLKEKFLNSYGVVADYAMLRTEEWGRLAPHICDYLSSQSSTPLVSLSRHNISAMQAELCHLSERESAFLSKIATTTVMLSHGTDFGAEIKSEGIILCGPLVDKDVPIMTSERNRKAFNYEHNIFLRVGDVSESALKHRYGRSTFLFPPGSAQDSFFDHGWFTFFDPLKPFHGSIKTLDWPEEFGSPPLSVEGGGRLRNTDWKDEAGYRFHWTHSYPSNPASYREEFSSTVFVGADFFEAVGLKVVLELRRIAGNGVGLGVHYRDRMLEASPRELSAIVYRDFFRIEAKIPGGVPVHLAPLVESHKVFRRYPDGSEFPFSALDPFLRELQLQGPGEARLTDVGDCVKKLNSEISRSFKRGDKTKLLSLIARDLSDPKKREFIANFAVELDSQINRVDMSGNGSMVKVFLQNLNSILDPPKKSTKATKGTPSESSARSRVPNKMTGKKLSETPVPVIVPTVKTVRMTSENVSNQLPPRFWDSLKSPSSERTVFSPLVGSMIEAEPRLMLGEDPPTENDPLLHTLESFVRAYARRSNVAQSGEFVRIKDGHRWTMSIPDLFGALADVIHLILPSIRTGAMLSLSDQRRVERFCDAYSSQRIRVEPAGEARSKLPIQQYIDQAAVVIQLVMSLKSAGYQTRHLSLTRLSGAVRDARARAVKTAFSQIRSGALWPNQTMSTVTFARQFSDRNMIYLRSLVPGITPVERSFMKTLMSQLVLFKNTDQAQECADYGALLSKPEADARGIDIQTRNTRRNTNKTGMTHFAFMRLNVAPVCREGEATLIVNPKEEINDDLTRLAWVQEALDPTEPVSGRLDEPAVMMPLDPLTGFGHRVEVVHNGELIRNGLSVEGALSPYRLLRRNDIAFVGKDIPAAFALFAVLQLRQFAGGDPIAISDNRATPANDFVSNCIMHADNRNFTALGGLLDQFMAPTIAFPVSAQFWNATWVVE